MTKLKLYVGEMLKSYVPWVCRTCSDRQVCIRLPCVTP